MRGHLLPFLIRLVPGAMIVAVLFSILAGASTASLFAFIFSMAYRSGVAGDVRGPLIFGTLAVLFLASRSLSALAMAHVGRSVTKKLRSLLIDEILRTPYRQLEMIGTLRLTTAATADIQVIANAAPTLVSAVTSFAVVASLLAYIAWISPSGAALILAAAAFGVPAYSKLMSRASKLSYQARSIGERLHENLNGLVSGIKQLRLNSDRTSRYVSEEIVGLEDEFLSCRDRATVSTTLATNTAQSIFLMLLGSLLFLYRPSEGGVGVEFFFATIYLMGPLDAGVGAITSFVHIDAVFRRNQELGMLLSSSSRSEHRAAEIIGDQVKWESIRFSGVTYSYDGSADFAFGPIDLLLKRGEIVFVKGGNGSGKSTFAKLLSGLYDPEHGSIYLDQSQISESNRPSYRERFCCIFDDSYIFKNIWSRRPRERRTDDACSLIREWSLERSVDVRADRFTNTEALSRGQKKKLLLISTTLEDREICIFDEWAADQDALSRRKFYYEYLPQLRRAGKLVVVLTHDEGFDAAADRIIKFQDGKLVTPSDEPAMSRSGSLATGA